MQTVNLHVLPAEDLLVYDDAFAQVLPPIAKPENIKKGLRIVISKVPRIPEQRS